MEMNDCKIIRKREGDGEIVVNSRYPVISFSDEPQYNEIKVTEKLSVGEKVVIKLIARVSSISESSLTKNENGKVTEENEYRGEFEILEAGVKPYGEEDMREKGYKRIVKEIDETLK